MTRKKFTIICYGVSTARLRTKVAKLLEVYGTRRNKSVFECMLTAKQLQLVRQTINDIINPKIDTVLIYRVCLDCYLQSETIGKQTGNTDYDRTLIL